ncbi:MAG: AmmeMemoRadiSam system protein B [Verrucomicrobiae bacterium]|nr:AmmeMemoRadiSam system protein B [Verrucomicrobiae bacterium]
MASVLAGLALLACSDRTDTKPSDKAASQTPTFQRVRQPAVAGAFYDADPVSLSKTIDQFFAAVKAEPVGNLVGLICPHAGYVYSGLTAAHGYKQLIGGDFRTVILMAASHTASFAGVSVGDFDAYRTPLGLVPISEKSKALGSMPPFVMEPRFVARRPDGTVGEATPETFEHSGEVQVPFLQKTLKDFKLVSLVFGQADPAQAAQAIATQLDDKTLLIASTDLSHYHPYDEANAMDKHCIEAICNLDLDGIGQDSACGRLPVLTLMHLAKTYGWKTKLLDHRNSGDTAGGKDRVVGYAAIAFYATESSRKLPVASAAPAREQPAFTREERRILLELARRSVNEVVTKGRLPTVDGSGFPRKLLEPKGCFVTLTKNGQLRGCIGNILPHAPPCQAIMENSQSSATRDTRFPPVQPDELKAIEIEISVLTVPQLLPFSSPEDLLNKLHPHKDGVVLQIAGRGATYLPQVWEQIPDKVMFLSSLSQKAGCPPDAWRGPGTTVHIYHVEHFKESEL